MPSESPLQNGIVQPPKPGAPGATPVGMAGSVPAPKQPNGRPTNPPAPGAPAPGGAAKPAAPPDPYDKLNADTIKTLKLLVEKGIDSGSLTTQSNAADIQNFLSDVQGWDSSRDEDRILELMNKYDVKSPDEFFKKLMAGELDKNPNDLNAPSAVSGVGQQQNSLTKGSSMSKKVFLKDGVLVEASADVDATPVLNALSLATRKVEACVRDLAQAKLVRFAADALEGIGGEGAIGGDDELGGMGDLKDLAAPKGGDPVASAIKSLKNAVEELEDALEGAGKLSKSDDLGADDADKLDGAMKKSEGALGNAGKALDADLPMMSKGIEASSKDKSKKAEFPFFMKKKEDKEDKDDKKEDKDDKKEEKDDKKEEKDEKNEKEAVAGDKKKGDKLKETMDAQMGGSDKKVSASEVMAALAEKLAAISDENGMIKEAQLYPFKDINKTNPTDQNGPDAKFQATEINSEIKGQPAKDKENARIAPKDILDGNAKPSYESGATKKIDIKTAEKLRQHSVQNAVAKAKLAVELASQQQLKGLISNPLHVAMVKNMTDAGITKEAAEAIAYNSLLDGYEPAQKEVMKEAFDTFMNHSLDDFVKVAKYTQDYTIKEAGATEEDVTTKTASVADSGIAPLRAAATDTNRSSAYRNYWTDVAAERRKS